MKHLSVKWLYALLIAALLLTPAALAEATEETPAEEEIAVEAVDEIFEEAEGDFGDEEALWVDEAEVDPFVVNIPSDAITVSEDAMYAAGQYGSIDIHDAAVTLEPESFTYSGDPCEPIVTLKLGETTLVQGVDYVVTYVNNVNSGTGNVNIYGIGQYTGMVDKGFTINRVGYKLTARYTGEVPTKEFDGNTRYYGGFKEEDFEFYKEDGTVVDGLQFGINKSDINFDSPDAGPRTLTIKFTGSTNSNNRNYSYVLSNDTLTIDGVITPYPINRIGIGFASGFRYTGAPIEPEIRLNFFNGDLVKGTDYDVAYSDNVEPGTATITITGKGNYGETLMVNFKILPIPMTTSDICIVCPGEIAYTGSAITPDCSVIFTELVNGALVRKALVNGTDYDISFDNNVGPGPAIVTVVGKGHFEGTCTSFFYIKKDAEGSSSGGSKVQGPNDGIPIVSISTPAGSVAPAPAIPTIPAVARAGKAAVSAAPGAVYQLNLGGVTGKGFKSSKKKVATVSRDGLVTVKGAGKTRITFKVGKKKRTVTLTVKDPTVPTGVALSAPATAVKKGDVITLTPSLTPAGTSSPIQWKSSNKKVATVSNGVVTFKKAGKVTITATAKRGKKRAKVTFRVSK